jgi:phage terminase small subunit
MVKKDILTKQDKVFVKEMTATGNGTQASKKAYGYESDNVAAVMATNQLKKVKIQEAIKSIADQFDDEELVRVHKEGLKAGRTIYKNNVSTKEIEEVGYEPDYATRHKYLDSAYKIKGTYAPEKKKIELDDELLDAVRGRVSQILS